MYVGGSFEWVQKGANPAPGREDPPVLRRRLRRQHGGVAEHVPAGRQRRGLGPAGDPARDVGRRRRVHQRQRRAGHHRPRRARPDDRCRRPGLACQRRLRQHDRAHAPGQGHGLPGRLRLHRRPINRITGGVPSQGPGDDRPGRPAAGERRQAGRHLEAQLRRHACRGRRQRPVATGSTSRATSTRSTASPRRGSVWSARPRAPPTCRDCSRGCRRRARRRPTSRPSRRSATTSGWAGPSTS